MSADGSRKKKDKGTADFFRACRYLLPYWRMVMASILCAVFVSIAFTGGLGSLLPIMRVLINGQTVAQWADANLWKNDADVVYSENYVYTWLGCHACGVIGGLQMFD